MRTSEKLLVGTVIAGFLMLLPACGQVSQAVQAAVTSSKPVQFDQFGGFSNISSPNRATGLFRVEKFGSRWMFVDPANNAFFMIGSLLVDELLWGRSESSAQAKPPLARRTWPLTHAPSGPARKDTTFAISSGWPNRSSGDSLMNCSICA